MCSARGTSHRSLVAIWVRGIACLAIAAFALSLLSVAYPTCAYADYERYVLLADTHLGQPYQTTYEEAEEALYWASELSAVKAVCVAGDLTDRGDPEAYNEWEFMCDSILDGAVRIQALGDHDTGKNGEYLKVDRSLTVANGASCFREINGGSLTSYREFKYANIMTIGGIRASGYSVITNADLALLNARLKRTARQGKTSIVICHYPFNSSVLNKRATLMGILRSYPNVIYVSGHMHLYSSSAQNKVTSPSCTTTPYARAGFSRSTKYSFRSIGVNACSAYRSGNKCSYADLLTISQSGRVALQKWNLTKGHIERIWAFNQLRSSITVKCAPSSKRYPKKSKLWFKVVFSDGGTYGGVKSGSLFALTPGKSKTFRNIPAGVLLAVKLVKAPAGWSKGKARYLEVTGKAQMLAMKPSYSTGVKTTSSGSRLRAAT